MWYTRERSKNKGGCQIEGEPLSKVKFKYVILISITFMSSPSIADLSMAAQNSIYLL